MRGNVSVSGTSFSLYLDVLIGKTDDSWLRMFRKWVGLSWDGRSGSDCVTDEPLVPVTIPQSLTSFSTDEPYHPGLRTSTIARLVSSPPKICVW